MDSRFKEWVYIEGLMQSAYHEAGSPAGVHTLGAGLYRFPAVARAVLSAGGGKEAGLIWHS